MQITNNYVVDNDDASNDGQMNSMDDDNDVEDDDNDDEDDDNDDEDDDQISIINSKNFLLQLLLSLNELWDVSFKIVKIVIKFIMTSD